MSRQEFAGIGQELEKWPTSWKPSKDSTGDWDGDWTAVNNGTGGRAGEATDIDGSADSDYADEFSQFVAQLVNTCPKMLAHIDALESAIRETIPVLDRAGRAVLATKLRKLIGG